MGELDGGVFAFVDSASEGTALLPFPAAGPTLCHVEGVSTPLIGARKTQGWGGGPSMDCFWPCFREESLSPRTLALKGFPESSSPSFLLAVRETEAQ